MGRLLPRTSGFALALVLAALGAGASGCSRGAKSPDQAYQRLAQALEARDGLRLYDALDLDTRWSWMSIQRAQRESYDILLSNFPEGTERERQLRRCEAGALSESARSLFSRQLDPAVWKELAASLPAKPAGVTGEARAEFVGADGRKLIFVRHAGRRGGWGFAGLAEEAEQIKRRALADLDVIRTSAADYERAATRKSR
jgi:hypothetical protein